MTHNVLFIGGHGKVALLAIPLLVGEGHEVTAMFRNPDQQQEVEATGAQPLVKDLTRLSVSQWADLLRSVDVAVWSAGAGGKGTAADTYEVDRDSALRVIDALESLGEAAPRFVMVSYLGSVGHSVPEDHGFFPYADAKEAVDLRLASSKLDYVILAPARLTDDPVSSITIHDNEGAAGELSTSRHAVAEMIAKVVADPSYSGRVAFTS